MNTDKIKPLKTLTISRKRWLTAKDVDREQHLYSMLYRPKDRKMCCLGFLGRACGAKIDELDSCGTPADAPQVNWPAGVLEMEDYDNQVNSDFVLDMINANDERKLTQHQREKEIRRLFKKHLNIMVKFVP